MATLEQTSTSPKRASQSIPSTDVAVLHDDEPESYPVVVAHGSQIDLGWDRKRKRALTMLDDGMGP
jgi:hypothetical protein